MSISQCDNKPMCQCANVPIRKILLMVIFSLCALGTVFAQKDAKAKDILDKASATFSKAGDLSAAFTMNIKDVANGINESSEGSIEIQGAKYHIVMPDNEIWFNGKTQWVFQKSWDEVNISEPSEQEVQALNPGTIFSIYKKGCNYKYLGEKTDIKMRKVHEIELIPQNKKGDMAKIILQVGTTDLMPSMIHVHFTNKVENIIYITKYQTNLTLSDTNFTFDKTKYPNAEIIDLR